MHVFLRGRIVSRLKFHILRFPSRVISLQRIDARWLTASIFRIEKGLYRR